MNLSRASADGVIQGAFNEYLAKTTTGVCLHGCRTQSRKNNRQSKSGVFSLTLANGTIKVKMEKKNLKVPVLSVQSIG